MSPSHLTVHRNVGIPAHDVKMTATMHSIVLNIILNLFNKVMIYNLNLEPLINPFKEKHFLFESRFGSESDRLKSCFVGKPAQPPSIWYTLHGIPAETEIRVE
jgi:hypothetical protein